MRRAIGAGALAVAPAMALGGCGDTGDGHHGAHGEISDVHIAYTGDLYVVHAGAGQTARATVTIDEPGTYEIYCSVPGHRQSGMTATLTVTESS